MENIQNNTENKKTILLTIVAGILVLGALVWWARGTSVSQQAGVSPTPDAEAAAINKDVDNINVGDLNAELEAIDEDINGL